MGGSYNREKRCREQREAGARGFQEEWGREADLAMTAGKRTVRRLELS